MTKSRKNIFVLHSPLALNLYRLRAIAMLLEDGVTLPEVDRKFLISALHSIGSGNNAEESLGIKRKRGEKTYINGLDPTERRQWALSWIATAIKNVSDGGLGLSIGDAIEQAAEERPGEINFGFSEETLRHYWDNYPKQRTISFAPPLSSEPIKRKKNKS